MSFQYSKWLELSLPTRNKIASTFGIIKKGSTEVFNNTIKSDGYLLKELEHGLSHDTLKKFYNSDKEYSVLWSYAVDLAEGRVPVVEDVPKAPEAIAEPVKEVTAVVDVIIKKKRGRPSKQTNA